MVIRKIKTIPNGNSTILKFSQIIIWKIKIRPNYNSEIFNLEQIKKDREESKKN